MVDAVYSQAGRAQHLCAAGEPDAAPAVLAVAADAGGDLARRGAGNGYGDYRSVVRRLGDRLHQHLPDQSFRTIRIASGCQPSCRTGDVAAGVPDTAALQVRAASDLPRLYHRLLGDTDDDRRYRERVSMLLPCRKLM